MRLVMDDIAADLARGGYRQFEVVSSKLAYSRRTIDGAPRPDEALHESRELARLQRLGNLLLTKIGDKDPIATKVVVEALAGVTEPSEQAAKIGCTLHEVYEAQRRLKYHAAVIKAHDEQDQATRMNALREKAKDKETT